MQKNANAMVALLGPALRAASWTSLPRWWSMASSVSSPCAYCKGLPADCWGRRRSPAGWQRRCWATLSFPHCLWSGCRLPYGEPGSWLLDRERRRFRRSVWRGRLFLYESHCVTALRCRQAAVFRSNDDCRGGHTHLLRWASHISQRAPIFEMIKAGCQAADCSRLLK